MNRLLGDRVCLGLVLLWIIPSVLFLLAATAMILREPGFPLGLGLIQTKGLQGLWVTAPLGLWGLAAVALLFLRRRLGAKSLVVYCLFWAGSLSGGVVKDLYDSGVEIDGLTGILVIGGMVGSFILVAWWSWHQAFAPTAPPAQEKNR